MSFETINDARAWLQQDVWPLWLDRGVDWKRGAFVEHLNLHTFDCTADFRRLRVVARQIYTFSQAAHLGIARAGEAVTLGLDYLDRHALRPDGGYASRFTLDGDELDGSRDLYDHAFVLLALASAYELTGNQRLALRAKALVGYIRENMTHPEAGFNEGVPPSLPRRQNPHMHLFEACIAGYKAFGDQEMADLCRQLGDLFLNVFFDAKTGTLAEYFTDALQITAQDEKHVVEAGHHCEWMWLIARFRQTPLADASFNDRLSHAAERLMVFVDTNCRNPATGTLYDEVVSDGTIRLDSSRLWPQTERLKAEVLRRDATPDGLSRALSALSRHIVGAPQGLWHERLDVAGKARVEPCPASSLYHITCGILECRPTFTQ